jgi:hypothetical protein
MSDIKGVLQRPANRRKFLKNGMIAAGATMGAGLLSGGVSAFAFDRDPSRPEFSHSFDRAAHSGAANP